MNSSIVITMAGEGKRFRDVGYSIPKYEIEVKGRTLFSWSVGSLRRFNSPDAKWVFVARYQDRSHDFIARECTKLGITSWGLTEIDHLTDGQATTVLHAEPVLEDEQSSLCIYNIDTYVNPQAIGPDEIRGDGWIPCFPGKGDHWSFVKIGKDGRAIEVREKKRISAHCTVGLYWFASFSLYRHIYQSYYGKNISIEENERYVAPMYNYLISEGREVYIYKLSKNDVIPLGTPEEVDNFRTI